MTQPRNPDHARHDRFLVAAGAAGDLSEPRERAAYLALVRDCLDCSALAADLGHVRAAVRSLPPRPLPAGRELRLDAATAARLRRRGLRGFLGSLAGARLDLRPVGGALSALGLAGLLLTVGLPALQGAAGTARDMRAETTSGGTATPLAPGFADQGAGPTGGTTNDAGGTGKGTGGGALAVPTAAPQAPADGAQPPAAPAPAPAAPSLPILPLISLAAIVAGIALWRVGRASRRLG
jgi:hypothetical protein